MTAAARPRRLRLHLTLLYTLATAVCWVLLAAVAAAIDADLRASALDAEIDRSATALSRAVYYDDLGALHVEPLRDVLAASATPVSVLEWIGERELVPHFGDISLPASVGLREVAEEAPAYSGTALVDGML